jgi:hypothetical protein
MRPELMKLLRAVFHVKRIRLVTLTLSSLHVIVLGHNLTHDAIFTLMLALCYLYVFVLEQVAAAPIYKAVRWAVIVLACLVVGRQLTVENSVQLALSALFQLNFAIWQVNAFISGVLLMFEVLAAVIQSQIERTTIVDKSASVRELENFIPFEVRRFGEVLAVVLAPGGCPLFGRAWEFGFHAVIYDSELNEVARLHRICNLASWERWLTPGHYYLGLRAVEPGCRGFRVVVKISIKND